MKRRTLLIAGSAVLLVGVSLVSLRLAELTLPLGALLLTLAIVLRAPRVLAWRLAALGSLLWTLEESVWAYVRISGTSPHLLLTDIGSYGGAALWVAALLLIGGRELPTALSLLFLPALVLLLWIDSRHLPLTLSLEFPLVDMLLSVATLPALEAALRGRASEGRLLWTFGFFVRALTAGTMSWLFDVPGLTHGFLILWLLPYAFISVGVAIERTDEQAGMWAAGVTVLGLETVTGIMLTLLYRSALMGTTAALGIALLLGYVQFAGILLILLSDRRRRIHAERELKAWGDVIDRVVTLEPGELGALGTLEALLSALSMRLAGVKGVEVYGEDRLRAGEPFGYALPLVTRGTEVGRLYLDRQPRDTGVLDAVTPFLAGRIQQALDQATWRTRALTDPLTGLLNRRGIELRSDGLVQRAREASAPLSVAMLDVDHFKRVNDFYDHATGDRALRETAQILHHHLRQHDLAARWGGEEFLVLLMDADRATSAEVVRRIRNELRSKTLSPIAWSLTLSAGIAGGGVPGDLEELERWILQADRALVKAKDGGRDRVEAVA